MKHSTNLTGQLESVEGQKLERAVVKKDVLSKTKRRCSSLKLEDILDNLGSMEEIDWGKPVGQEVW
jgi:antitoxin component of MazEF toxin-antitoxin module